MEVAIEMLKKIVLFSLAVATFFASGCMAFGRERGFDAAQANRALDAALARSVVDEDGNVYRNAVIYVDAPNQNFAYAGAAGMARADTRESMTVDHQFFIASVGKPMTAVIIFQLWEEGAFLPISQA
jgi:CubicO group peptidase (beta-lactamase class C family)